MLKPKYVYFYKNDIALDDILQHAPFCYDKPINSKISRDRAIFDYEHITLVCYKGLSQNMRAVKGWQILVEDELYDELDNITIRTLLEPMMIPNELLGGRVVKINKYNQ